MEFSITTPILLFPAISLILLAYTAKFVHLAALLRNLRRSYLEHKDPHVMGQIRNIRIRIYTIRNMQALGTVSFFFCIASIFLLFYDWHLAAKVTFWTSMIFLITALILTFKEVKLSSVALKLELNHVKDKGQST